MWIFLFSAPDYVYDNNFGYICLHNLLICRDNLGAVKQMVIVKLVFMTTNILIHNFGQCARIGVRSGLIFSSHISNSDIFFTHAFLLSFFPVAPWKSWWIVRLLSTKDLILLPNSFKSSDFIFNHLYQVQFFSAQFLSKLTNF